MLRHNACGRRFFFATLLLYDILAPSVSDLARQPQIQNTNASQKHTRRRLRYRRRDVKHQRKLKLTRWRSRYGRHGRFTNKS